MIWTRLQAPTIAPAFEFALDQAIDAANRIRTVLEAKQWALEPSGERVGKVTVSLGVAQLPPRLHGKQ
jgi:PleD family two-component response regulator